MPCRWMHSAKQDSCERARNISATSKYRSLHYSYGKQKRSRAQSDYSVHSVPCAPRLLNEKGICCHKNENHHLSIQIYAYSPCFVKPLTKRVTSREPGCELDNHRARE